MPQINGKKIAVLATEGFEQSELEKPVAMLRSAGATVEVVSLRPGQIKGRDVSDWGRPVEVDRVLDDV